mgnify:CR=1 FL=1
MGGGQADGGPSGPSAHSTGHVQAGRHLVLAGQHELARPVEPGTEVVDQLLESVDHRRSRPAGAGLQEVEAFRVGGQLGHNHPKVGL